jgi:hypothetical protein
MEVCLTARMVLGKWRLLFPVPGSPFMDVACERVCRAEEVVEGTPTRLHPDVVDLIGPPAEVEQFYRMAERMCPPTPKVAAMHGSKTFLRKVAPI